MKICVSEPKKFVPRYIFFGLLCALLLFCLSFIGNFLAKEKSSSPSLTQADESRPILIIDAGHGGEDGGAVGINGVYEKDINLFIAKTLDEMLRANGIQTVMTRTEDILLYDRNSDFHGQKKVQDLATRRKIAEQYDNAIFISIHMNSFPQSQYSGLQVYFSENDEGSAQLAKKIQDNIQSTLSPDNTRKIKPSDGNIYLLDRLNCPAVLIECGFLSNPTECALLSDAKYRQQLSLVICCSLMDYLSEYDNFN